MRVLMFCKFGLKILIHAPKIGILRDLTHKGGIISLHHIRLTEKVVKCNFNMSIIEDKNAASSE